MYRMTVILLFVCLALCDRASQQYGSPSRGSQSNNSGSSQARQSAQSAGNLCGSQAKDLSYDHAVEMIRLTTAKAKELNIPVSICIRDRHDNLVAHIRMKNAILGSVELSCQKARSSALFPFPSGDFKMIPGIELSNGIISNLRGGLPLTTASGVSVGSIGVSGAPSGELDEEIAKEAVDMLDFILKNYW